MILSNDSSGKKGAQLKLGERVQVEKPLLEQLRGLGWRVLDLKMKQQPVESYRSDFSEVIIRPELKSALAQLNPFLTDAQQEDLIDRITTYRGTTLLENNKLIHELLLRETTVSINEETGEEGAAVRYIDFENIENNRFLAVCQFKLKIPGTDHHIIPDITLFVNGLPLVVIECKSPRVKDAIEEGIDQLLRYSEQRGVSGEGNPEFFYYNLFWVSTFNMQAKVGTITTHIEKHHYRWADPYPKKLSELKHGKSSPSDQRRLVAGTMDKRNLLDLLRTFTFFNSDEKGKTIKIIARYQQFRAVKKAVQKLLTGKSPRERSGIIWHTQGSGKSLTMMFMVRAMRQHTELLPWKIVFITDRSQLEKQLRNTSGNVGFEVRTAKRIKPKNKLFDEDSLMDLIKSPSSDIVMAMIHKFRDSELTELFPLLNKSHQILTMTDEAHRSQYSLLGANLDRAIPNASRIAYTGTPIDKTYKTFGDFIDTYTIRDAVRDEVILEIVYEGRTHNAEVPERGSMDAKFADMFSEYNLQERLEILGFGSRDAYLEAQSTIAAKAEDMMRHYVQYVFTNDLKAQVVATSREAAHRYKIAIDAALQQIIQELEEKNDYLANIARLKKMESAVVISKGGTNDELHLKAHGDARDHDRHIKRFKMSFEDEKEGIDGNVGIIIVNKMLLTGFDAPIEQVLYLDQYMTAHNLLQAIARVNRVGPKDKDVGYVVDYIGIGHHLKRALDNYSVEEQEEILKSISNPDEEMNTLINAHTRLLELLEEHDCTDYNDAEAFFDLFYDEDIRFDYILRFRAFSTALNNVFPRKEALNFMEAFNNLMGVNTLARQQLQDERMSMKGIPKKLRTITDEYLASQGIDQTIAPISILSDDFQSHVRSRRRTRTQAATIEHAVRNFIDINIDEDPELFASFAEELERILLTFQGNWAMIYQYLEELRQRIVEREREETYGLNRKKQMPIFRLLKTKLFGAQALTEDEIGQVVALTKNLSFAIDRESQLMSLWNSAPAQNKLKAELQKNLLAREFVRMPNMRNRYKELRTLIMDWAKKNRKLFGA